MNVALTYILGQNIHGQESCLYNMNMNNVFYTWTDQKKKINYKLMQIASKGSLQIGWVGNYLWTTALISLSP